MFDLDAIQRALREFQPRRLGALRLPREQRARASGARPGRQARRLAAFPLRDPRARAPAKLVHRIEPGALDHLPGDRRIYTRWQEWEQGVAALVDGMSRVAMEYAPRGTIPTSPGSTPARSSWSASRRRRVVSSGDLIQLFEATWDDDQWRMHREAEALTRAGLRAGLGPDRRADR